MSANKKLAFKQAKGKYIINDTVIEDRRFDYIRVGPTDDPGGYLIQRCLFRNCRVAGPLRIWTGVALREVEFNNVLSADLFTLHTPLVLDRVVFSGKGGGLWIKPYRPLPGEEATPLQIKSWANNEAASISVMVDVRNYRAYVEILGLPLDKVLIDPARHVAFKRSWERAGEWKQFGLRAWTAALSGLDTHDCQTGIYTFPKGGTQEFDEAMKELDILRVNGVA